MMKIYEAADLAPDIYEGEYFQPSVKVYKKNDVDEEIKKKDELLKEMAEALEDINEYINGTFVSPRLEYLCSVGKTVMQKYNEQDGDTDAG